MIEVDAPIDRAFHTRRIAEEDAAAERTNTPLARALHLELAALHRMALRRARRVTMAPDGQLPL